MNFTIISLSDAVYDSEYMIHSVDHISSAVSGLRGYGIFPGSKIKKLFSQCCRELGIKKQPAFYISPLLKTPVMTGIIKPGVYLPAHLASDTSDISLHALRHMLLHELIHYKVTYRK